MATTRELTITVRAKNAIARGFKSVERSLNSLVGGVLGFAKRASVAFLAAGTAVVAFGVKALKAWSDQEQAVNALESVLGSYGDKVAELSPKLQAHASAIQDETAASDEATVASMARLRASGVEADKLDEAARAVVALRSANINGAKAEKMVAEAMQGRFNSFERLIPALRTATTETEKAALVNDYLNASYKKQKDRLGTVGGAWDALKGQVGELWEEIGKVIAQDSGLQSMLTNSTAKVKEFIAAISEWYSSGGMLDLVGFVKDFGNEFAYRFKLAGNSASILWASMQDGAESVFTYLINAVQAWWDANKAAWDGIATTASATWKAMTRPSKANFAAARETSKKAGKDIASTFVRQFTVLGEFDVITDKTDKAFAERAKIEEDYAKRSEEIAKESEAKKKKFFEEKPKEKKGGAEDIKAIDLFAAAAADEAEARRKAEIAKTKAVVEESKRRIDALKAEQDKISGIAESTVQEEIERRRAGSERSGVKSSEGKRFRRLQSKVDKGIGLAKKDQEFYDAAKAVRSAKDRAGKIPGEMAAAENAVAGGEAKLEALTNKIEENTARIAENIEGALSFGGAGGE